MTTLIIGKTGQVGFELMQAIKGAVGVDFPEIDLSSPGSIREVVRHVRPEVIINAAAYTAVDLAESEQQKARSINAEAPRLLAEEAKKSGALLVHYSTEYVFDGTLNRPYTETDTPNPLSFYGKTKLEGDLAIQSVNPRYLILRTSWVYGARGRNFLLTMLKLGKEKKSLSVVDDQIGAPTWCRELAITTTKLIDQDSTGLYNATGSGRTSWHGFAECIFALAGLNPKVAPIPTEQYPTPAKRPKNSCLNQSKLAEAGIVMDDWKLALAKCMQEI